MTRKNREAVTVGFVALGCPKNIVDSEKMLAEIAQAHFLLTTEPDNADVVVINTCGFIAPAKAEALEAIKHAVACKLKGTVKKVIVAGCLPQRLGTQLFNEARGIDAIVGLDQRDKIARIIKETLVAEKIASYLGHKCQTVRGRTGRHEKRLFAVPDDRARLLISPAHWAYLRISEGCNHRCSFCTVPAIRGRFRSKPPELIIAEAAELVSAGAVELVVIAQDTTYYARDLKKKDGLKTLLKGLEGISGLKWIRLMYSYPAEIDGRLIETIAASEKIVHYLDMPIQHINDKILRAMHRPDTKARICTLIQNLRSAIPDIVLRTTLIAGFPGETDRQFNELLDFIKWARFDALGCFKFYPESGTTAAQMAGRIPEETKNRRVEELMLTQQKIAFAKNTERIGTTLTCLVDSVDAGGTGKARYYGQAPDIDSICIIRDCSTGPGQFVDTKVVGTKDYDLIVERI